MNDDPKIKYLGDVQRLSLQPSDWLVLSVDEAISSEMATRLRVQMEERFPGNRVLILGKGMTLGVVTREAA
jgi:hypothetical protein